MLGVAGDNASNVGKMVTELEAKVESFRGAHNRVRCLLHVLNLVARVILALFDKKDGSDLGDLDPALTNDDLDFDDNGADSADEGSDDEDGGGDDDDGSDNEEGEVGDDEDDELEDLVTDDEISESIQDKDDLKAGMKPLRVLQHKVSTTHLIGFPRS